jgi:hypothetical protein
LDAALRGDSEKVAAGGRVNPGGVQKMAYSVVESDSGLADQSLAELTGELAQQWPSADKLTMRSQERQRFFEVTNTHFFNKGG